MNSWPKLWRSDAFNFSILTHRSPIWPNNYRFVIISLLNKHQIWSGAPKLDCNHFQRYGITNSNELTYKLLSQKLYTSYASTSTDQQSHPAQNGVGSLHWALSGHVIAWLSFYLWTVSLWCLLRLPETILQDAVKCKRGSKLEIE